MSDEPDKAQKTEEPTAKKLQDAAEKGDVAKSQELSTFFVLMAATLMLATLAGYTSSSVRDEIMVFLAAPHAIDLSGDNFVSFWRELGYSLLMAVFGPFILLMIAAILGNLVQHQLIFSVEPIKPKFSKISPLAGLKRLFGAESLVNFGKGLLKLSIISVVIAAVCWPERDRLDEIITASLTQLLPDVLWLSVKVMLAVLCIVGVIAAADFAYQKHKWHEKQKMTLQEVKDEFKQMEGDPLVKAKIRQLRMERGRSRMMAAVPDADLILTNPTHFSVALKYKKGMSAPICLAKGVDDTALRIRELAKEHDIPLVENPPLTRALYATTDIDEEVPEEHYKAVAEVIGYIYRLKNNASWRAN